jgi:hypothetical protein
VIEHVPTATRVTAWLETVQTNGVVDAKVMGRLDDTVALSAGGVAFSRIVLIGPNVMVCGARFTAKV